MSEKIDIVPSSGNVFAGLGFADPDLELLRADLALRIKQILARRGWTDAQAADTLGVDQPTVTKILLGRLDEVSPERLMQWLNKLNYDVHIVVAPNVSNDSPARIAVEAKPADDLARSKFGTLDQAESRTIPRP